MSNYVNKTNRPIKRVVTTETIEEAPKVEADALEMWSVREAVKECQASKPQFTKEDAVALLWGGVK